MPTNPIVQNVLILIGLYYELGIAFLLPDGETVNVQELLRNVCG